MAIGPKLCSFGDAWQHRHQLRLHRKAMDAVRMQTFAHLLRLLHEAADGRVVCDGVQRGDCLLLVEAPDVEFVD